MAGSCRWSSGGLKCPGSEQDKCTSGGSGHSCWCRVAFLILQFLVWFLRMHVFLSMNVPKAPIQIAPPLRTCTKCCKVLSEKRPFYFEVLEGTTQFFRTVQIKSAFCLINILYNINIIIDNIYPWWRLLRLSTKLALDCASTSSRLETHLWGTHHAAAISIYAERECFIFSIFIRKSFC